MARGGMFLAECLLEPRKRRAKSLHGAGSSEGELGFAERRLQATRGTAASS